LKNAQNHIYTYKNINILTNNISGENLSFAFNEGGYGGNYETLTVNFKSPCAKIDPDTAIKISFSIPTGVTNSSSSIRPFKHRGTSGSCMIFINGVNKTASCEFT